MTAVAEQVVGSQTPRVAHVPSHATTSGDEAIELAASAGLVLDPWQQLVLRGALGERPDGQWTASTVGLIVPRQNGKGSVLEAMELAALFLFGDKLILHTAHELKTAKNHYERMRTLIRGSEALERRVKQYRNSNEEISIELHDGAKLRFIARSSGSGRGFSAHRLVLDEAMILSDETMAALRPTLTVAPNPQTWFVGSAGMETSDQLLKLRKRGHTGADRLAFFEWSAPEDADVDDPATWAQSNPALGRRLTLETIEDDRTLLDDTSFARERCGIWPDERRAGALDMLHWHSLRDRESAVGEQLAFAVDISEDRRWCSISSAAETTDGRLRVELVESKRGTDWAAKRLAELVTKWRPCAVLVRPASPAGALLPDLEREGVDVVKVTETEMGQACGFFADSVDAGRLTHVGQPQLNVALDRARKRRRGEVFVWHPADSGADISPLNAATMAAFGFSVHAHRKPVVKSAPMYGF